MLPFLSNSGHCLSATTICVCVIVLCQSIFIALAKKAIAILQSKIQMFNKTKFEK